MRILKIIGVIFLFINLSCAQLPADRPHLTNDKFDAKVVQLIDFSVPVISVEKLQKHQSEYIILDAREKEEYEISHIENARFLGYKDFDVARMKGIPKDADIVLYCSVGYRSEKVGEQLQKLGYNKVYNLFGSIFEWVNQGYPVVDKEGKITRKVHTYNKKWSQWVEDAKAEKTW